MATNVKKQSAFAANASRVAVERASVGDLKGAAEVLELAATDSGVGAAVAYFGMRDGTGLSVVALCDRESLQPIAGDALSDVLRVVHETGGAPPRARKHVWRVMSLADFWSLDVEGAEVRRIARTSKSHAHITQMYAHTHFEIDKVASLISACTARGLARL